MSVQTGGGWGGHRFSPKTLFLLILYQNIIPVPLSSQSLSFISSTISSIFFLSLSGRQHKMTHKA